MFTRLNINTPLKVQSKNMTKSVVLRATKATDVSKQQDTDIKPTPPGHASEMKEDSESERMKEFRKKLKLEPIPRISPGMRFVDLVLVETDPKTGELIPDSEKEPTKWGDWQIGGRVSDF
ncbi:succinate dehydrogenase assembly factor 4, mitochondrial-like [Orussus abietinus]|uniref:succinate dehydrogenase assembly factor 4, mitochondrial-like n=1 Tax=Orussus abietinus TaxID=222816 RepID=UPI000625188E|nr:succinate dehydrogenase assembly factor 4, mitochondrial-like [Orussus abietinus]